jgi:hypothetical protein
MPAQAASAVSADALGGLPASEPAADGDGDCVGDGSFSTPAGPPT